MTAYDLITVGRANMDLYSRDIGEPFENTTAFDAMVGGSPTNIAIGTARLGLRSIAFTGVGDDRVGDFVVRYLGDEGVETGWVFRKPGKLTSLAMLGVQPPDHFPLSFYREDPADIHLTVAEAEMLPWSETRAVEISGNALSRGTCAEATMYAARTAREHDLASFLDLDLRPVEWGDAWAFGRAMREVIPLVDVVIGTEEEFYAALADDPTPVLDGGSVPDGEHDALDARVEGLLTAGSPSAIALKRGKRGVSMLFPDGRLDVAGFPVEVVNTVGAGDAFASGFIRSRLRGAGWEEAARFANACGAIEVTRHGCASAFPTEAEVLAFLAERT
jgi:5-dehydro-2-deoxygluconokinase